MNFEIPNMVAHPHEIIVNYVPSGFMIGFISSRGINKSVKKKKKSK